MTTQRPSGGLFQPVLAAAIALVLSTPLYASDHQSDVERRPADNSANNAGDDAADKLTPLDQSAANTDVTITRSIRQRLVDDDTLGTNAQNVKVITINGIVTLRGPVATAEEQARIVAIAREAAGKDRVTNELEVITR